MKNEILFVIMNVAPTSVLGHDEIFSKHAWKDILGCVSLTIAFIAYALYIGPMLRPHFQIRKGWYLWNYEDLKEGHALTWFQWGVLTGVACCIQIISKGIAGAWVTGLSSFFCFLIAAVIVLKISRNNHSRFSIIHAYNSYDKLDQILFWAAIVLIPLLFTPLDNRLVIVLTTSIDVLGYASIFRNVGKYPDKENAVPFGLNSIKYVFGIAALETYSVETCLYPAALIIMNALVVFYIWKRKKRITEMKS